MEAVFSALQAATAFFGQRLEKLENYSYTPLPDKPSIRLVSFHQNSSGQIHISLSTHELEKAPSYHALSYTWGSPFDVPNFELPDLFIKTSGPISQSYSAKNMKPIVCDGQRMHITLNLKEALERLRRDGHASMEHRYIWVDAICINQKDFAERSAQVLLMGEIYKRAESVIVWLGDSLPETTRAIDVLDELAKIPWDRHLEMGKMLITAESTYEKLGIRRISDREWRAFVGFSRRAYFSRVWVVQEAAFARRLSFICGEHEIHARTLSYVGKMLVVTGWSSQILTPYLSELQSVSGPHPGSIAVIFQMQEDLEKEEKPKPLEILASMRSRHATDPRDKVFGLLNLIAKALSVGPSQLSVLPNYKLELADVLEQATLMCIRAAGDLSFLPAVQERKMRKCEQGPSWIVDWSAEMAPYPLMVMQLINKSWNPSDTMPLETPNIDEPGILKFPAARICSIEDVSLETEQMQKVLDLSSWVDIVLRMKTPYGRDAGQGLTEILWRTVIADIGLEQHPAPRDFGLAFMYNYIGMLVYRTSSWWTSARFEQELEDMVQQLDCLRLLDPDTIFPDGDRIRRLAHIMRGDDAENETELMMEIASRIELLGAHINRVCAYRRLARTDNNLLGMVPCSTQQGDSIWIIPGLATPFVFRKVSNSHHEFIGEAYIHGIMQGEAGDELHFEVVKLQ